MSDVNSLVQMIKSQIQQNAQAALPVIPNNGNPNGANNMPSDSASPTTPAATGFAYPWMAPSPSMDAVHQMLAQPIQPAAVPQPMVPTPNTGVHTPVLPQAAPARNAFRQEARANGDFYMMPKLGQQHIATPEQQQLPVMPMRGQGY